MWYHVMSWLEDEQAQIQGIVQVLYHAEVEPPTANAPLVFAGICSMLNVLPYRTCAFHLCFQRDNLMPFLSFFQTVVGKHIRMRFRTHQGSGLEIIYALMSYGITELPIEADGSVDIVACQNYIIGRRQKEQEEEDHERKMCIFPSQKDVILGRGKPYHEFSGNRKMAAIMANYWLQYKQATERLDKLCIASTVVNKVQESGGRFLQRNEQGWETVDDSTARLKVTYAFRNKPVAAEPPSSCDGDSEFIQTETKRQRFDIPVLEPALFLEKEGSNDGFW